MPPMRMLCSFDEPNARGLFVGERGSEHTPCAFVFSAVTMDGGEGAFGGVESTVNAIVRAVRNEVKLHSALADKTVPFLMVYAEGETLEEVLASMPATPKAWTETFTESWAAVAETQMPSVVYDRAAVWAGVGKTLPLPAAAAAAAFEGEDAAGRGGAAGTISGSGPFGDDYLAKMMEGLNVSEHDKIPS